MSRTIRQDSWRSEQGTTPTQSAANNPAPTTQSTNQQGTTQMRNASQPADEMLKRARANMDPAVRNLTIADMLNIKTNRGSINNPTTTTTAAATTTIASPDAVAAAAVLTNMTTPTNTTIANLDDINHGPVPTLRPLPLVPAASYASPLPPPPSMGPTSNVFGNLFRSDSFSFPGSTIHYSDDWNIDFFPNDIFKDPMSMFDSLPPSPKESFGTPDAATTDQEHSLDTNIFRDSDSFLGSSTTPSTATTGGVFREFNDALGRPSNTAGLVVRNLLFNTTTTTTTAAAATTTPTTTATTGNSPASTLVNAARTNRSDGLLWQTDGMEPIVWPVPPPTIPVETQDKQRKVTEDSGEKKKKSGEDKKRKKKKKSGEKKKKKKREKRQQKESTPTPVTKARHRELTPKKKAKLLQALSNEPESPDPRIRATQFKDRCSEFVGAFCFALDLWENDVTVKFAKNKGFKGKERTIEQITKILVILKKFMERYETENAAANDTLAQALLQDWEQFLHPLRVMTIYRRLFDKPGDILIHDLASTPAGQVRLLDLGLEIESDRPDIPIMGLLNTEIAKKVLKNIRPLPFPATLREDSFFRDYFENNQKMILKRAQILKRVTRNKNGGGGKTENDEEEEEEEENDGNISSTAKKRARPQEEEGETRARDEDLRKRLKSNPNDSPSKPTTTTTTDQNSIAEPPVFSPRVRESLLLGLAVRIPEIDDFLQKCDERNAILVMYAEKEKSKIIRIPSLDVSNPLVMQSLESMIVRIANANCLSGIMLGLNTILKGKTTFVLAEQELCMTAKTIFEQFHKADDSISISFWMDNIEVPLDLNEGLHRQVSAALDRRRVVLQLPGLCKQCVILRRIAYEDNMGFDQGTQTAYHDIFWNLQEILTSMMLIALSLNMGTLPRLEPTFTETAYFENQVVEFFYRWGFNDRRDGSVDNETKFYNNTTKNKTMISIQVWIKNIGSRFRPLHDKPHRELDYTSSQGMLSYQ